MSNKLHIIFKGSTKAKKNIDDGDNILTNDFEILTSKKDNTIIDIDKAFDDKEEKVAEEVCRFLQEYYNGFPEMANSIYASIFKPLYSIIDQIDNIIKERAIGEIVLYDGSEDMFFTLFYGEGEGESWLYRESWFFNGMIYQYYKNTIDIVWKRKYKNSMSKVLNIVREDIIHLGKFLGKLYRRIGYHKTDIIFRFEDESKKHYIAMADLQLQYNQLRQSLNRVASSEVVYLLHRNVVGAKDENILYYEPLDFKTIVRIDRESKRNCLQNEVTIKINGKEMGVPRRACDRAIHNFAFEYYYKHQQVTNSMNQIRNISGSKIISNMTFGADINIIDQIAKEFSLPHINIQYASMSKMLYPRIELADYYLYAKSVYEFYRKYSDSYNYYLPIIELPRQKVLHATLRITIFLQPDLFTAKYLDFMNNLFQIVAALGLSVKIAIKPHYRQNMEDKIAELALKYVFVNMIDKGAECAQIIRDSDLVLSMTSSVLNEAFMLGKMAIIVNYDKKDRGYFEENDIGFPNVNFICDSIGEIIAVIENYESYYEQYLIRYREFMKINKVKKIEEVF